MKKRITEVAKELGIYVQAAIAIVEEKVSKANKKGSGKNTWLDQHGQDIVRVAVDVPTVVPSKIKGRVIGYCRNDRWVFCRLDGLEGRHPVLIPLKLRGKLLGKPITVDAITDISGTTYRHECLG